MSLYKYILNALPLLYQPPHSPFDDDDEDIELGSPRPADRRVRQLRLSVSGSARQAWTEKRTRAWFSVVAGAIGGGVAIMFEKRSRRIAIGQQMFVRSAEAIEIPTAWYSLFDIQRTSGVVQWFGRQVWVRSPIRCSLALLHRVCPDHVRLCFATGHAPESLHLLDRPSRSDSGQGCRYDP